MYPQPVKPANTGKPSKRRKQTGNGGNFPHKLARTLKGHIGAVNVVKFNTDGKYCLSGGKDKNINLWNPIEGSKIKTYSGYHGYEVRPSGIPPLEHQTPTARPVSRYWTYQ